LARRRKRPFRRAVEENLIDPKRVIQIGIRGSLNVADMWQFKLRAWHARSFH